MEITDFSELWRAVNKIKIDVIAKTEIRLFENEGIDTDLTDVYTRSTGELFTVLKDGSIRKTIVHICDISNYRPGWPLPKFHIFECNTLQNMRQNNRGHRYKKASRTNGEFWMIRAEVGEYSHLDICMNCLQAHNKTYDDKQNVDNFKIERYLTLPIRHIQPYITQEYDMTTIPKSYANNWDTISRERKQYYEWICQECFYDFSNCEQYLHTHHIDADIANNQHENLKVLCVVCHAQEYQHGHIRNTREYNECSELKRNYAG